MSTRLNSSDLNLLATYCKNYRYGIVVSSYAVANPTILTYGAIDDCNWVLTLRGVTGNQNLSNISSAGIF